VPREQIVLLVVLESTFDESVANQFASARCRAAGDQRFAQPNLADAGLRRAIAEPQKDGRRIHAGWHGFLGARENAIASGPVGMIFDELRDLGELRTAVFLSNVGPLDESCDDRIARLRGERAGLCPTATQGRGDGTLEKIVIDGTKRANGRRAALAAENRLRRRA